MSKNNEYDFETMMEFRVRMLLRDALVSKSGCTLADTVVLAEIARRLGYDADKLVSLDITDLKRKSIL